MSRTGQQIISDVRALINATTLPSLIGGRVYREGTRPRDSKAEDLVIVYTTADNEQFQRGVVTLNIYVPFIPNATDGVMYENSARCEALESEVKRAVESLTADKSNYLFRLREAVHTQRDDEIEQSFIVAKLGFRYID